MQINFASQTAVANSFKVFTFKLQNKAL